MRDKTKTSNKNRSESHEVNIHRDDLSDLIIENFGELKKKINDSVSLEKKNKQNLEEIGPNIFIGNIGKYSKYIKHYKLH